MKKHNNHDTYADKQEKEWRGYTLDQLEQIRLVNAVKCDLLKEQLQVVYLNTSYALAGQSDTTAGIKYGSQLSNIINYAGYGYKAYRYIKGVFHILRNLKK